MLTYSKHYDLSGTYTLQRSQCLKSRKTIAALFAAGQGVSVGHIRALHMQVPHSDGGLQVGFSAPARQFRQAVQRNRVKRLLREAWRLQQIPLREYCKGRAERLSIFLIYRGREVPDQAAVMHQVAGIIEKLQLRYVRQDS
jgi:ribonuclease P protein component